jgi:PAS domain S-box-containing protein
MLRIIMACVTEQHDLRLVLLAAIICLFACAAAVNLFIRARDSDAGRRIAWLSVAAFVFGSGVWTTHFVAELAYQPGIPIGYDVGLTSLSAIIAVSIAWIGMAVALSYRSLAFGGGMVGAAVGAMHFVGMAALRVPADLHWNSLYVVTSLAIGIALATAAFRVLDFGSSLRYRAGATLLLILAIVGLHFTAMAAVVLELNPAIVITDKIIAPGPLAIAVSAVTILIISLGMSGAIVDNRLVQQATREAERLRRSQEHLARAQRIARTGSIERDLRTGFVSWSDETYRIFGLPSSEGVPSRKKMAALIHPDDREACMAIFAASDRGVAGAHVDGRLILGDGTIRWVRHESEVFYDKSGEAARWIGTFTDVTVEREAEARQNQLQEALLAAKDEAEAATRAVQAANGALERRVEERTAELRAIQGELLKSERLSTLGQVTATVAHELRNPLGAINNTIYALKEITAAKSIDAERPLARLRRSVDRCNQIITELLDFTSSPELVQHRTRLDEWLAQTLGAWVMPQDVTLDWKLDAGGATVALDSERFQRVLANLIANAAHAIQNAEVAPVSRRVTVSTAAGEMVTLRVTDTGPGIAPDVLPKVFEPLFSTKSFGTGLGLPTVRQIVQQHGGTVRIDSTPGHGTTVEISLPRVDQARQAA